MQQNLRFAGLAAGSKEPDKVKVGKISKKQVTDVVKVKTKEMNARSDEAAFRTLCGSENAATPGSAGLTIDRLRCEYLQNPSGIDVTTPRLSWVLHSDERGQKQTAYQVLVASTTELLDRHQGDLWDSGRVESAQTIHVEYSGTRLQTRMQCFWKVRTWDKRGTPTPWSTPARWSMGLLQASDWGASWIAGRIPAPLHPVEPSSGYHSEPASTADAAKWVAIDLGGEYPVDAVQLHPAYSLNYNWCPEIPGFLFPVRFTVETARRADFSDAITVIDESAADLPNPRSSAPIYRFEPVTARHMRLNVTRLAPWHGSHYGFALAELQVFANKINVAKSASVTATDSIETGPWGKRKLVDDILLPEPKGKLVDGALLPEPGSDPSAEAPATMVRTEFNLGGPVRRATVSVTGLGLYELRLNGRRVGDHVLAPEWTRYNRRIVYQTYDVTEMLHTGANALGAQISGGWWTGPLAWQPPKPDANCSLLLRLDIELADGSQQSIVSDRSWRWTNDGPIRRAGIYFGETYDGTREMPGWDQPGFTATGWQPVYLLPHPDDAQQAVLVAQANEPIRVVRELQPVNLTEPKPGVYVFDLGQNMVGWCRLTADVPVGTRINLRYAEMLNDDGTIYTANLAGAAQIHELTWSGGPAEVEPHFTYFGFRYVEVTGLPYRPTPNAILGRVFHSATPDAGIFSCSNELINRIMHCVEWVQRANMMSVPTDCPQRVERMGWMGDIQSFAQTSIFNMDMAAFLAKCVQDIRDRQAEDGRYPDVVALPHDADRGPPGMIALGRFSSAPAWADAGTIVPWRIYQNYADVRLLGQHYDSARRWVEYVRRDNPTLLWQHNRGNNWNDWLNGDVVDLDYPRGISSIPREVFATAFFAHSLEIVAKMAAVLGHQDDAATYANLFKETKAAFNRAHVTADGRITGDTQAGYALALHFNLLDEALRPAAMAHLMEGIARFKNHLSTGIHTTHRMMLELTRNGRHDEACRLINLRTAPSWGFMVEMGATTIWERWDGYVKGRGFSPSMNSFNHWVLGSVGEWVWRELAGINPDEEHPGYQRVVIRPRPGGGLTWMKSRYDSIRGPIVSEWRMINDHIEMRIRVPPGTTATVHVPSNKPDTVTESGRPVAGAEGITLVQVNSEEAVSTVESGDYRFATP